MSVQSLSKVVLSFLIAVCLIHYSMSCSKNGPNEPTGGCEGEDGEPLPVQPENLRVDKYTPVFTTPLTVSNPLFPVSLQHSYVMTGLSDGLPFRTEVTLLPGSKTIQLHGQPVQALISQYCAFLDGEIHEVALDWYAQDNQGAVWYLGEDVFNYEAGAVAEMNGSWLAGEEGPEAMIMPASPKVGDVYRPENACGIVFEEVTVKQIGVTVDGPRGPVTGAIIVEELHMDATREAKTFAPGYGEFTTGAGSNLEALAVAVPTDAIATAEPSTLATVTTSCDQIYAAAKTADWTTAENSRTALTTAWNTYQSGSVPPRLRIQFTNALTGLNASITSRSAEETQKAAVELSRSAFDIRLRYLSPSSIDKQRFRLWLLELMTEIVANEPAAMLGAVSTLEWTRDRFVHTLSSGNASQLNSKIADLRTSVAAVDYAASQTKADELLTLILTL